MKRRQLLAAIALGVVAQASAPLAAQTVFPERSVRMIVPFPPGGASDVTARVVAERLSKVWGQSVVVDNRPGATGVIGTGELAKSVADGYTLALVPSSQSINAVTRASLPYDTEKDFTYISVTASVPLVLVTSAQSGIASVQDLVARAKQAPGKLTYASSGVGGAPHFAAELLNSMAGLDITHVPYKGSTQAHPDLISHQVDIMYDTIVAVLPHLRSGRMVPLAVTSAQRSALLPAVPTLAELGYAGYEAASWGVLIAPAGLAADVTDKIARDVRTALSDEAVRAKLGEMGAEVVASTPAEANRYVLAEIDKWRRIAQAANIRAE